MKIFVKIFVRILKCIELSPRFGPRPASRSDEEELLGSSDESATPELNPPPPPTAQLQQDVGRRGSFGGGGVLRSEVAQGAIHI